jgi:hypothetical protein
MYTSGSTKFGDTQDDTHEFTGSVNITGSLKLNGVTTASTTLGDDSWKELIKNSKFAKKESPDFGKIFSGHISLQDHGDNVYYRNIQIKRL